MTRQVPGGEEIRRILGQSLLEAPCAQRRHRPWRAGPPRDSCRAAGCPAASFPARRPRPMPRRIFAAGLFARISATSARMPVSDAAASSRLAESPLAFAFGQVCKRQCRPLAGVRRIARQRLLEVGSGFDHVAVLRVHLRQSAQAYLDRVRLSEQRGHCVDRLSGWLHAQVRLDQQPAGRALVRELVAEPCGVRLRPAYRPGAWKLICAESNSPSRIVRSRLQILLYGAAGRREIAADETPAMPADTVFPDAWPRTFASPPSCLPASSVLPCWISSDTNM